MSFRSFFALFITYFIFLSPSLSYDKVESYAKALLINNDGIEIGKAQFFQGTEGVLIYLKIEKLSPGKHGMHFHNVGSCSDTKEFKKAGPHIHASEKPHGYLNPKGPHAGNLPNLFVHNDGTAEVELYSELVSLYGKGNKPALLDEDGSTLIIHKNSDDHYTQPIGGAGKRIACGSITPIN